MAQNYVINDNDQQAVDFRSQYAISAYDRADGTLKYANDKGYVNQGEVYAAKYALGFNAEVGDTVTVGRMVFKVLGKNAGTITLDSGKKPNYRPGSEFTVAWRQKGDPKPRQPKASKAEPVAPVAPTEPMVAEPMVARAVPSLGSGSLADALQNMIDLQTAELRHRAEVAEANAIESNNLAEMLRGQIAKLTEELESARMGGVKFIAADPKEVKHPMFDDVLVACQKRLNVFLTGPAGTGKTCLAKAVARALGLPCYTTGAIVDKTELTGYVSPRKDELVETSLYQAMKFGGVFLFDEIDCSYPEAVKAFNEVLANRSYTFPNKEVVNAHPDFIVIAGANTIGEGATAAYNAGFKMDASTKDRFVFIPIGYMPQVDLASANGDADLVEFANAVREVINADRNNNTYVCSPRGIRRVKEMEILGKAKALGYGLFNAMSREDAKRIISNLQGFSEWFDAAQEYASQL